MERMRKEEDIGECGRRNIDMENINRIEEEKGSGILRKQNKNLQI